MAAEISAFYDDATGTISYVVADPVGACCAVIDSVLDFDTKSGRTSTGGADTIIAHIRERGYALDWILETHAHADHLTAAPYLKEELGGRTGIGIGITAVQKVFAEVFNLGAEVATDGSQWDRLFADGERAALGGLEIEVMHTPGHTPACVSYRIGDAVFTGDTIFMPDSGTARCDFPGGSAEKLYASIGRILALPAETRIFVGHDYGRDGRSPAWETTVAEEREANIHVGGGAGEDTFVARRKARDAELAMPALILPAIQINIRCGAFPTPEANGISYLKLPLNAL